MTRRADLFARIEALQHQLDWLQLMGWKLSARYKQVAAELEAIKPSTLYWMQTLIYSVGIDFRRT